MTMQPRELAEKIATIADDKKGKDILLLNMEGISYMTDYFVIASACVKYHPGTGYFRCN